MKHFSWLILILLCFNTNSIFAQKIVEIDENFRQKNLIREYASFLVDKEGDITLKKALNAKAKFKPVESPHFFPSNKKEHIWVRFELDIRKANDFILSFKTLHTAKIYYKHSTVKDWKVLETSLSDYQHKRPYYASIEGQIPVSLKKTGTYEFYIYSQSIYPIKILTKKYFEHVDLPLNLLFFSFCFGALFVILFYNLFILIAIKDKIYLYYVIYLITNTFTLSNSTGILTAYDLLYFDPDKYPSSFFEIPLYVLFISLLLFAYKFLRIKESLGNIWAWIYKITGGMVIVLLLSLPFLTIHQSLKIDPPLGLWIIIVLLASGLRAWKKNKEARFFVLAFLAYFIFVIGSILYITGMASNNYLFMNGILVGSVLEALFLSFALADQINIIKKEKEKAERKSRLLQEENEKILQEQNDKLEEQVEQRTFELQESNEELQVMNEELRQTQEEVQAQRDFVEEQNKRLKKSNQKLETSEQILRKMNEKVKEKNEALEFSNQKINSSIKSAKSIQEALLPTQEKLARTLGEYFLIYRPKDMVSGDFYWITEEENSIYLAASDCTGHGVPGAFMANMGMMFLYSIIKHKKMTSPAAILETLHQEVSIALKQSRTGNNNGMDITLLRLEECVETQKKKLIFAGAKHNLFYFEKDIVKELKGNRKSIGGIQNESIQFQDSEVCLSAGSLVYIGSDGLEDQNNAKRKKFGKHKIKQIIQEIHHLSLSEQQTKFEEALDKHMENTLQRDDILWLGIRL